MPGGAGPRPSRPSCGPPCTRAPPSSSGATPTLHSHPPGATSRVRVEGPLPHGASMSAVERTARGGQLVGWFWTFRYTEGNPPSELTRHNTMGTGSFGQYRDFSSRPPRVCGGGVHPLAGNGLLADPPSTPFKRGVPPGSTPRSTRSTSSGSSRVSRTRASGTATGLRAHPPSPRGHCVGGRGGGVGARASAWEAGAAVVLIGVGGAAPGWPCGLNCSKDGVCGLMVLRLCL